MSASAKKATTSARKTVATKARKTAVKSTQPLKVAVSPVNPKNRKAKAAAPSQEAVRIFQIHFEPWQRDLLDPRFIPFDNSGNRSERLEFDVFTQLETSPLTQGAQLWGAVSWRYGEKTGLQGQELLNTIAQNPGQDVYYSNPHPQNEAIFHNLWLQGETAHPRFLEVVRAVFDAAGLNPYELTALQPSSSYSSANYFVASPQFWALYIPFITQVLATAEQKLPAATRKLLHSQQADPKGLHGGASYVPFIVERLFGYFMRHHGSRLKAFKVPLPQREAELQVHHKLLRDMKDVAHRTKSAWLAACWLNYRNLFLTQTQTKTWCTTHLMAISPTEVRFV